MTKKRILDPMLNDKYYQIRYEFAKELGYIKDGEKDWWESLTNLQKSEINGMVTRSLIEKAQRAMVEGTFNAN